MGRRHVDPLALASVTLAAAASVKNSVCVANSSVAGDLSHERRTSQHRMGRRLGQNAGLGIAAGAQAKETEVQHSD